MRLNDLRQQILNIINNSQMSVEVVYFVIKDIFKEIEQLYYLELQKEQQEVLNKQKEEENKESDK